MKDYEKGFKRSKVDFLRIKFLGEGLDSARCYKLKEGYVVFVWGSPFLAKEMFAVQLKQYDIMYIIAIGTILLYQKHMTHSILGLVVKSVVAIDGPRVRFPEDAH